MYLAWSTKVHKNIARSFLDENILKPVNTIQNSENHIAPLLPTHPAVPPFFPPLPPPHAYKSSGNNIENKQKRSLITCEVTPTCKEGAESYISFHFSNSLLANICHLVQICFSHGWGKNEKGEKKISGLQLII